MNDGEAFFVDTNLLVYSVDPSASSKYDAARHWMTVLWATRAGRLSWQVLNEFYAVAVRKISVPAESVRAIVMPLTLWQPVGMTPNLLERAWNWTDTVQISYWDALIVSAAEVSGCRWLLTEDLQHRQTFHSVTILNPFEASPDELGLTD